MERRFALRESWKTKKKTSAESRPVPLEEDRPPEHPEGQSIAEAREQNVGKEDQQLYWWGRVSQEEIADKNSWEAPGNGWVKNLQRLSLHPVKYTLQTRAGEYKAN